MNLSHHATWTLTRLLPIAVLTALALLATPALAGAATPQHAATATASCLKAHGWKARLADHGVTVDSQAPRQRDSYPSRPWFSVAFYDAGDGVVRSNAIRMALNRRETHQANRCIHPPHPKGNRMTRTRRLGADLKQVLDG